MAGGERPAVVRHGGDQVQRRARVRAVAVHPARVDAARAGLVRTTRAAALMPAPLAAAVYKVGSQPTGFATYRLTFESMPSKHTPHTLASNRLHQDTRGRHCNIVSSMFILADGSPAAAVQEALGPHLSAASKRTGLCSLPVPALMPCVKRLRWSTSTRGRRYSCTHLLARPFAPSSLTL